ncbi:hypothetical protein BB561_004222 [Smittium simulii]|uniref:Ras-GAP domain-containing protein n=1 Tax=Smittium simulii TaxID=133385 RepID=A0A2T9YHL0_9FUNG|nr:hypothetical protein BB561_004222 [Smittium simulii]
MSRENIILSNRKFSLNDPSSSEIVLGAQNYILYQRLLYLARTDPVFLGYSFHSKLMSEAYTKAIAAISLLFKTDSENNILRLITFMIKAEILTLSENSMILRDNSLSSSLIRLYCEYDTENLVLRSISKDSAVIDIFYGNNIGPLLDNNTVLLNSDGTLRKKNNKDIFVQSNAEILLQNQEYLIALNSIVFSLLSRIESSLFKLPTGIREIASAIKTASSLKFPDFNPNSLNSLIGGFFFLRFINPAIIIPERVISTPIPSLKLMRKTLTLIAKIIQHLANHSSNDKKLKELQSNPNIDKKIIDLCIKNNKKIKYILQEIQFPFISSNLSYYRHSHSHSPPLDIHKSAQKRASTPSPQSRFKDDFFKNTILDSNHKLNMTLDIDHRSLITIHELILETANYWENLSENCLSMEVCLSMLNLPIRPDPLFNNPMLSIDLLDYDPNLLCIDNFQ